MRDRGSGVLMTPTLVTCAGPAPRRGAELEDLKVYRPGAIAWTGGVISEAGDPEDIVGRTTGGTEVIRVNGAVLPGFVDCHTHLPFHGWRADEFEARLSGRTYRDIHGEGGIYRSARLLASASDDEVVEFCREKTEEMLAHGTTALELKTGYGLSVDAELRQARLARRLAEMIPQKTSITLLACHAVPEGRSRDDWVSDVCRELIPAAASEGLVEAVDVYVEDIAFTRDDLRKVADAAREHGLAVRCHADQLGATGATEAAVEVRARSADHLNHISAEGVTTLAESETIGVLLPVSTLFLRGNPPPAKELIDGGATVAIATDFNPGTSPCLSLPEVMSVAASLYGVGTNPGLAAATINAASALGIAGAHGSLEPGKRADFVVLDHEDPAMIAYRPGHNPVVETWVGGVQVWARR